MVAAHRGDRSELVSRRGNDFADRFPEVAAALLEKPDAYVYEYEWVDVAELPWPASMCGL